MRLSRADLEAQRDGQLPDLAGPGMRLLFVGINPGLRSVAAQAPFSPRGNRFYPALFAAGITDRLIDASDGFAPVDREHLIARGIGISGLVERPTASADELDSAELTGGLAVLEAKVRRYGPTVVAVLGITAYRIAFADRHATPGHQDRRFAGRELWVVPNPSGRNAHATVPSLAAAYREVAIAAGIAVAAA